MRKNPLVIYHGNCADGFGAAWAVRQAIPHAEFYAGHYGRKPPDVADLDVILVDFSFKRDVMFDIAQAARSVLVLDHHTSAEKDLAPGFSSNSSIDGEIVRLDPTPGAVNYRTLALHLDDTYGERDGAADIYTLFDMKRSGAGIAWDFFHPGKPRPQLINHIEDRDLWRFELAYTREIQSSVLSYPYDFNVWDGLMCHDLGHFRADGAAIERKHMKDVRELVESCKRRIVIDGVEVWAANIPYLFTSDAGNIMSVGEPFAACYWDTEKGRVYSLRSQADGGADVSVIASKFGGGGHKNAAGFNLPHGVSPEVAP